MTIPAIRTVIVKQLPESCNRAHQRTFLSELNAELVKTVRPSVVLDCAHIEHVDTEMLNLLLCCLEETMKRNGDVRLAAIPAKTRPLLEFAGIGHLFRTFASCADAISSYRRPAAESMPQPYAPAQANSAANAA